MSSNQNSYKLPTEDELGLHRLTNEAGIEISILPNGCVFAIEHVKGDERMLINQVLGSPLGGGIGRVLLRFRDDPHSSVSIAGSGASGQTGFDNGRFVWEGETGSIAHRVTLWLHPKEPIWFWWLELENRRSKTADCDAILIQDLGLGARGTVLSNEAYASQYIDHTIGQHTDSGPVVMSRQNLAQFGRHLWVAHGCLDGAASFATDVSQIFGPEFRQEAEDKPSFGADLPGAKLQHEAACAAIQSNPLNIAPGDKAVLRFFGLYQPHHPEATDPNALTRLEAAERAAQGFQPTDPRLSTPVSKPFQDAPPLTALAPSSDAIAERYPERLHEEWRNETLLSFFVPDGSHNRHIVLTEKERLMQRRHGTILRSGDALLPEENLLSATCWMHGIFAAQLTIGNTALHKLFSVSRDPYNITRTSGLRIFADRGKGWQLLAMPSLFEMGLSDCRWIYLFEDGAITVHALISAEDTAMQWHITASGEPCRFLICGHLVLGEHEFRHHGLVEIDETSKCLTFRPDPDWLWGQTYPKAVHHLVVSTPAAVEALGSGRSLFKGEAPRAADAYAVIKTKATSNFSFALVGDLKDPARAKALATKYQRSVDTGATLDKANRFWTDLTGESHFSPNNPGQEALDTILPWFAHNAMIHLTAPRGLEQYTAAAWGTRDVCQGPVECLLPLGHHETVKEILRIVFSQQYETNGDWPQWFMLEPYDQIRDRHSHGDIIVWPLKALCDYLEASGDTAFLDEPLPWTRDDFTKTAHHDPVTSHLEKLFAAIRERFIPGTHLIRYGLGDWNDSLQPADPAMRDWMVSSWTPALLYQQIIRFARIFTRMGEADKASELDHLAVQMHEDFNRYLLPGGTVAGYALFKPDGTAPDYILHPTDSRTGVHYSLIPMTRAMIAGLFTPEQARHHLSLIREHLAFPDGVRLMDKPVPYHGGIETNFRRAESAAFFGREIGLMYSHAHLRYCEALGLLGEMEEMRKALRLANPITVTEDGPNAALRQRNAYFSSSDAAFPDRYKASAEWARVKDGTVEVDGGWRIYSSGPGIFIRLALQSASRKP